jgi:two-component system, NarL family, sensor histidine kinase BarA
MWRPWTRGISLANKCLLLFGGAVVLIVLAALTAPWIRMQALVGEGQLELSRQLVQAWERLEAFEPEPVEGPESARAGIPAQRLTIDQARELAASDPFIAAAIRTLERDPRRLDIQRPYWVGSSREYRYAKALRTDAGDGRTTLDGLILLARRSGSAAWLLAINTVYLLSAGTVVLGLAVLVFYLITHKLILSPVRSLRITAERVREGEFDARSDVSTGDEFEELSGTFNSMLSELQRNQDQLRSINSALDVKLTELSEANTALYEAAKLKGEFLANVSHELRTPMNSIIGFAELLLEIAQAEAAAGDDSTRLTKRIRYLENIVAAARSLLEMITSLLEMAKIEAGRVDLRPAPLNLAEACQGILGLIAPLAERKGLQLILEAAPDLPAIETDLKKFQHIIFNFLSNAVKFTDGSDRPGAPGRVTLRAERLRGSGELGGGGSGDRVRVSVIDTGPGIAAEDQERIFEKFQQLDGSHTREHPGTGLGLAICKELAALLQGEIQLVSEVGRGSMFSLILPARMDSQRVEEAKLEAAFRGSLAGRRSWVKA